jgi:hypothetical protein
VKKGVYMQSSSTSVIPVDLVGEWGHYVGEKPVVCIKINKDGSGHLIDVSDVKWVVNGKILGFRKVNNDFPGAGSAQYSINDGKLSFSEPFQGDFASEFSQLMNSFQNGLDKVIRGR